MRLTLWHHYTVPALALLNLRHVGIGALMHWMSCLWLNLTAIVACGHFQPLLTMVQRWFPAFLSCSTFLTCQSLLMLSEHFCLLFKLCTLPLFEYFIVCSLLTSSHTAPLCCFLQLLSRLSNMLWTDPCNQMHRLFHVFYQPLHRGL